MRAEDRPPAPGPYYPTGAPYHTGHGFDEVQKDRAENILPRGTGLQGRAIQEITRHDRHYGITSMELATSQDGDLEHLYTWAPRLTELGEWGVFYHDGSRRVFTDQTGRRRGGRKGLKVWKLSDRPVYKKPAKLKLIEKLNRKIRELRKENHRLRKDVGLGQRRLF
jgi:hypothetical protein